MLLSCLILLSLSTASAQSDTAKGGDPGDVHYDIDIKWEYPKLCVGKINTATITITNPYPYPLEGLTFTIQYDDSMLEFISYTSDCGAVLTVSHGDTNFAVSIGTLNDIAHVYTDWAGLQPGVGLLSTVSNNMRLSMGSDSYIINQNSGNLERLQTGETATLPRTGFSAKSPLQLDSMPLDLTYEPLSWKLDIPVLSVESDIVEVPFIDGDYPVAWLGNKIGFLEGSDNPGEGVTILAGHNNLDTTETGPFALLKLMESGDRIFLQNAEGEMLTYMVYANEKISETDVDALNRIASRYEKSLTLMTCEDELISGGFANRRVIAAKLIQN